MSVITVGYGRHLFIDGNTERHRMESCAREAGIVHMIVFTSQKDGLVEQYLDSGLVLHPTNSMHKLMMIYDAIKIGSKLIKASKSKVVVSTQDPFEAGIVGYVLKRRFSIPFVVQEHGDVFSLKYWRSETVLNRLRYQIGLFLLKRADVVRVVARRTENTLRKIGVTAPIRQLPVAIDINQFDPKTAGHDDVGGNKKEFWFLSTARLVKQKNFPLMIQAFAEAHKKIPFIRLRIVGRGSELQLIQKMIRNLYGNTPKSELPIVLESWSSDVSGLMHKSDAYLLTSNYEGWGRVLIEAIVAGLPIVTTDVGCVGEVVMHEQHGLVTKVDDQFGLTESIVRMATDHELHSNLMCNLKTLDKSKLPGSDIKTYGLKWKQIHEC